MKKKSNLNNALASFIAPVLYTGMFVFVAACSQHKKQKPIAEVEGEILLNPKITLLSQLPEKNKPQVILMDTVPKPLVIKVGGRDTPFTPGSKTNSKINTQKYFPENENSEVIVEEAEGLGFFSTLTTDDGLSLDQVYCSYKDQWGILWFGTNGGGVSKYDGKNFTSYTTAHGLANNVIWCITQDHQGNLWFGTDGSGVSKYDGETFTNYSTAQGLPDNVIFSIVEDKNKNLWFGTLKGVSKWNGKSFTNYSANEGLTNNAVKTILEDSNGNIWFGTLGGGVSKWNGKNFTSYTTKDGLANNRVWSIEEDNSGNLWFGTEGNGLSKYDGAVFADYPVFNESLSDAVLCITKDKQGNVWFGTKKSGVLKYDGKKIKKYSTANGLANNQIRAISEDEKGNLWFSSFGSGICKFGGNSFTNFTTVQGLSNNIIFSIEEDKEGKLWLGTSDGGVCRFDGKRFQNFTKKDGLPRNEIYCVLEDRIDNIWFGTSGGGVSKYNGKTFTNYTTLQGLANNIVFSILEDKKGNIWFGTSGGGVSKYDGKSITNFTELQGLASNIVFSIKEDRNSNLWFGTLGGGVSKFDGTGFTNYTVKQGLSDNVVWTITEDSQGNLWFGTQHGLSLLSKENIQASGADKANKRIQHVEFTSITTAEGLPNNFITQVIQGDGEKLYVGTNLGICELLPSTNKNSAGKNWSVGKIFNTQHGYPVKDVNAGLNAMFKDSKGVIWVGTGSDRTGLVRLEPTALANDSKLATKLFINKIKINNQAVCWRDLDAFNGNADMSDAKMSTAIAEEVSTYGRKLSRQERDSLRTRFAGIKFNGISKWQPLPKELVLPYYFNDVSFDFGAVETDKNFLIRYTYFLEGYNKDWSPPGSSTSANFGNINEGTYTFMVKAQSPEGAWSQPITYSFTVSPPWWRTWWMYTIYALSFAGFIILFSWWKHKRIVYQKKILEHKVEVATKQLKEENIKVEAHKKQIEETLNELKETQTQLIQSEKMASLGELTAGIAHEIQNPLNFVNNFSEVSNELITEMNEEWNAGNIDEAKAIANDIMQNLKKISHHGKRADAIVKGMLQHSRSSSGVKEPTNINALVDEYLRLAYHGLRAKDKSFNAAINTHYDETIDFINVVPQDIGRAILNILTNAFYAVNEKSKIIRTPDGSNYKPAVSVITKRTNNAAEIRIIDNGNGIPATVIDKIFQPFFTTKPAGHGTGLGLSMSYDIITKGHQGHLQVETLEGEGATFIIHLKT